MYAACLKPANAKIQQLDSDMLILQLEQKENSATLVPQKLKTDYEAYTYFDEQLKFCSLMIIVDCATE